MRISHRFTAALAAVSLAGSGCGLAGGGGADGDGPIKLGIMAGLQTSSYSHPWVPQGAKIAAAAINGAGGIGGRKVEVVVCDDKGTPQGAALCAQKLLTQDRVLMMVGDDGNMEAGLVPALKAAKSISWASLGSSLDSLKNDRVYVLQPVLVQYWIVPQMLPPTTRKVAYVSSDSVIAQESRKRATTYYPKSIGVSSVTLPATTADFQPTCLKIKETGADTAVLAISAGQSPSLIQACHQVGLTRLRWVIPSIEVSPQVVRTLTDLRQPNLGVLAYGGTVRKEFEADIAKYGPKVGGITNPIADGALNAWLGMKLLTKIIPAAGGPDAEKIKAWLDGQKAFDTMGATAPIDFTATPVPAMPRIKNTSATKGVYENGEPVVTEPKPYTIKTP
ncbi:ABC transporter substrate-binding protein [Actinomadura sp. LD22]|uniref:ABC transporter substrate-binding protein n=1 Tax=Actinomadura physcomitrii TaxID=2650748 RepID=A0A6I4MCX2_9ACTN|nr:ABC transporter substrate-binding protein [Actinomadura physcomitrii]MWA03553.1 ABC transporter substrate-binding protein [Actinomadura physcomitrii]